MVYINYEYDREYKPDKKYNIPKRTTIGKKCEDDPEMMYPNPNFLKYFPDAELPEDEGWDYAQLLPPDRNLACDQKADDGKYGR